MWEFKKLLEQPILREAALELLVNDLLGLMREGATTNELKRMYPGINEGCLRQLGIRYKKV